MITHSSVLSWRIPWTEEPGGLLSPDQQWSGHSVGGPAVSQVSPPHWAGMELCAQQRPGAWGPLVAAEL